MTYKVDDDRIVLTPIEQKYIATCYPLPDKPFLDEANKWKEILRETSSNGEDIEVSVNDIGRAFPHIGTLYQRGLFNKRSVRSYFEGTDQESHNMRMYLFAKNIARKQPPEHIVLKVLHHVECCSVKVADLDSFIIWSYGMTYTFPLDTDYFGIKPRSNRVFVHGKSERGMVVVRDVSEEEFEKFRSWFEERQSSDNPFVRFREKLKHCCSVIVKF